MGTDRREWVVSHGTFVLIVIASIALWVLVGEPPAGPRPPRDPRGQAGAGPVVPLAAGSLQVAAAGPGCP